ncbi:MAG: hypothetical protein LBE83_08590 [Propionibacteriaceae bacterium]|jgi:hypothetical protein|nr:hypothetical protein [Propionibacteriaceae bacterium]
MNTPNKVRHPLKTLLALVGALVIASLTIGTIPAAQASPGAGEIVKIVMTTPSDSTYKRFHDKVAGLPAIFTTEPPIFNMYHMPASGKVAYCIEFANGYYAPLTDVRLDPRRPLDATQRALLTLVTAQGPATYAETEEFYRSYAAVQLAAWLISENLYDDPAALDAVLFPATGDYPDTAGYAQTLDVGRLARTYLENAEAGLANYLIGPLSFTAQTAEMTTSYEMTGDEPYTISLTDTTGQLGSQWASGQLRVVDDAGMTITVNGDVMTISGPQVPDRPIVFEQESQPAGQALYLYHGSAQEQVFYSPDPLPPLRTYLRLIKGVTPPAPPAPPTPPTPPTEEPNVPPTPPTEDPNTPPTPPTDGPSTPPTDDPNTPPTPPTDGPSTPPVAPHHENPSPPPPVVVHAGGTVSKEEATRGIVLAFLTVGAVITLIGYRRWLKRTA